MSPKQERGTPFSASVTHGTAASASIAGVAGVTHYITDISASTDKAGALMLVKQGTTVVWRSQAAATAAGNLGYEHTFSSPIAGVAGGLVSVEIDGTTVCHANIAGFSL